MNKTFPKSERTAPCDVCCGVEFERLCERDRRRKPLATAVCRTCGLVSHESIPSDEELAAYYEREYREEYNGERTPSAYRTVREWRRAERLATTLRPFVRKNDRVFEVGCGMGCNVKQFERLGCVASGIEPGEGFAAYARDVLLADVRVDVLESLPREPQFDLVLLVHVLEHLPSPTRSLSHIRSMLRQGGRLYVEVPNFGAPHAAPGKLFHYAHIYNYTAATLQRAGETCGLRVERVISGRANKNLAILFQRSEAALSPTPRNGYADAVAALTRYNTFTYHARPAYFADRIATVVEHRLNRRNARKELAAILDACRESKERRAGGEGTSPTRAAA